MSTHQDPAADRPQTEPIQSGITRKALLKAAVVGGLAVPLIGTGTAMADEKPARFTTSPGPSGFPLAVTPQCHDGDEPTIAEIEGPYFEPGSPQATVLQGANGPGTPLVLTGVVYGLSCQPIANALLDFWQADNAGNYDNSGYTLRGHQYTDSQGRYTLTTIVPGLYPGRTKHIHVKVQAPNQPILTTQLYFPGVSQNSSDAYYDSRLLVSITQSGSRQAATYDFVLNVNQGPTPPGGGGGGTWVAGHAYKAGDTVTYNGVTYVCIQGHTSMTGWEPPNVPALWRQQ